MNVELACKVVEDVAVVAGTVFATLANTHDPAVIAAAVVSAPALRGVLAAVLSKGQERSVVGALRLVYRVIGSLNDSAGDIPAVEPAAV